MAKYQEKPVFVHAYKFVSVGPVDGEGNVVPDGNGNVTVQARNGISAQTIPFVFAQDAVEGFGPEDFIKCDENHTNPVLVKNGDFVAQYIVA